MRIKRTKSAFVRILPMKGIPLDPLIGRYSVEAEYPRGLEARVRYLVSRVVGG